MKHTIFKCFAFIATIWVQGCVSGFSEESGDELSSKSCMINISTPQVLSVENIVYHKETGLWLRPQNDPFTLTNFQNAYNNIYLGKSTMRTTSDVNSEFSTLKHLQATHYCVKFYPRNETQQWELEKMEDINISYIPFDYVPVTDIEIQKIRHSYRYNYLFRKQSL